MVAVAFLPLGVRADPLPVLAIYTFSAGGTAAPAVGAAFADAIADQVRAAGGIDVVRGAPTLDRSQFRSDARSHGADYFLIGAIEPVGSKFSVILELEHTRTGLLAWSSTFQAAGTADLTGQGTVVRQAVFDQIGRTSLPTPAPAPSTGAAAVLRPADAFNVPLSTPTPQPSVDYAVMNFDGSALPSDRAFAVRAVLENVRKRGVTAGAVASVPADLQTAGAQACMDTGAAKVVGGTLDTKRIESVTAPPATTASLQLHVYDCRTQSVFARPLAGEQTMPISTDAIRSVVDAALAAYFGAPLGERRP
jgi:hypothetical protein